MKILKKILFILLLLFVVVQFFRPEKNEGDPLSINAFYAETIPSEEVKQILEVSCNDCHSNVTKYPWYNNITPVNYWLAEHVNDGKKHFNISNWAEITTKKKDHKFEELIEMVEEKEMPLDSYTWVHTDAKLSDAQIGAVLDWAKQVRNTYRIELSRE